MQFQAQRNKKVVTTLTGIDSRLSTPVIDQIRNIGKSSLVCDRVFVCGPVDPGEGDGIRWFKTNPETPIRNLLGTYAMQIPGVEVCALVGPESHLGEEQSPLLEFVFKQKMELAWAAYACKDGPVPKIFVMSAAVVPHIMRDIPITLTFGDNWQIWMHEWMGRLMPPHRYVNASHFDIVRSAPPVLNAYDLDDFTPVAVQTNPEPSKTLIGVQPATEPEKPLKAAEQPVKRKPGRPKKKT